MMAIPLLSLPLLAGALIGLRHGAPARPAVAGAIAGMLSAGLAATLYASHCTDDSPLFVATWYTHRDRVGHRDRRAGGIAGAAVLAWPLFADGSRRRVCCMRWKRSTCCAVEGRSRS